MGWNLIKYYQSFYDYIATQSFTFPINPEKRDNSSVSKDEPKLIILIQTGKENSVGNLPLERWEPTNWNEKMPCQEREDDLHFRLSPFKLHQRRTKRTTIPLILLLMSPWKVDENLKRYLQNQLLNVTFQKDSSPLIKGYISNIGLARDIAVIGLYLAQSKDEINLPIAFIESI